MNHIDPLAGSANAPQQRTWERTRESVDAERLACLKNGYQPIEIKPGAKGELRKGWPEFRGHPNYNSLYTSTSILTELLRAFDFDIDDPAVLTKVLAIARDCGIPLADTIRRTRNNSIRAIFLFRAQRLADHSWPRKRIFKMAGEGAGATDILGAGNQFVAFGPHHSGAEHEWPEGSPATRRYHELPIVTEDMIDQFAAALAEAGLLAASGGGQSGAAKAWDGDNRRRGKEDSADMQSPLLNEDRGVAVPPAAMTERIAAGQSFSDNFQEGVPDDIPIDVATAEKILLAMPNDFPLGHPLRLSRDQWRDIAFACHDVIDEAAMARGEKGGAVTQAYRADDARLRTAFEIFSSSYAEEPDKQAQSAGKLWEGTRNPREITWKTLRHEMRQRMPNFIFPGEEQ